MSDKIYISRIRLTNIRGFRGRGRELDLRISDQDGKPRMRTAIIGTNGTGKTTLLRCIAMGLCGDADANALLAELTGSIIAEGRKNAEIKIDLVGQSDGQSPETIVTKLSVQKNQEIVKSQTPIKSEFDKRFVVGYGVGVSNQGDVLFRKYRILDSVYSLFNYQADLTPSELTIRRLRDYLGTKYYDRTFSSIKIALGLPKETKFDLPKGGGIFVSGPSIGRNIPLGSLADGYRITFSWILDLYAWGMLAGVVTKSGGIKGVLLVDELEKHIHPSLQTNVLLRLKKIWPELQIFGTTHSPLVALGALPNEVVVLRRDGNTVCADDRVPNFTGYSAEDMLHDEELFDTEVYAPETNQILSEYRNLASKDLDKLKPREKRKLRNLAQKLRAQQILLAEESPMHDELLKLRKDLGLEDSE